MMRVRVVSTAGYWAFTLTLFVGLGASRLSAEPFNPGCDLPSALGDRQAIDDSCPTWGDAATNEHKEQNRAKNNFCASGSPATVTVFTLAQLQNAVEQRPDIKWGGRTRLPEDRTVLRNLRKTSNGEWVGEGTLVRFVGFILEAHTANKESVNCNKAKATNYDIHIALHNDKGADHCQSITAEMSPHLRRALWQSKILNQITDHPVRITGHLFFDASHVPCAGLEVKKGNPRRVSDWEIHPVYAIEVCRNKSVGSCGITNETKWMSLEDFVAEFLETGEE